MALQLADRVKETTNTGGTGSITLAGAVTGFQSFNNALTSGNAVYYCIAGQGTAEWEVGIGTFTAPTTLSRDTVLSSSNAGALVNFSTAVKDVFIVVPAAIYSSITSSLGADVFLTNIALYFDGPSVAQGTIGTWFVVGTVVVIDTVVAAFSAKLWDGTTIISSASTIAQAGQQTTITLVGVITSPVGNIRISVKDNNTTNGKMAFNQSGNLKDSSITAIRIK